MEAASGRPLTSHTSTFSGQPREKKEEFIPLESNLIIQKNCLDKRVHIIYGAWSMQKYTEKTKSLEFIWNGLQSTKILTNKKQIYVTLFLEGDFKSSARDKKMIMHRIQSSLNKKLKWISCKVSVVDSNTYKERFFSVAPDGTSSIGVSSFSTVNFGEEECKRLI